MKIEPFEIKVRDLISNYKDEGYDGGVWGYHGNLDIRPPFQRNFIYDDTHRKAVIDTVRKNFPLGIMYWADRQDGTYEVIDGQQRTISIAQYVNGEFSEFDENLENEVYFHNLTPEEQNQVLDYEVTVYVCTGEPREKLDWFKVINVAGKELTPQELRNTIYFGTFLFDAKRYFSRSGCAAYRIGSDYLNKSWNRQEYLETAIKWLVSDPKNKYKDIEDYMAVHHHDENAEPLWDYFRSVIGWIESTFTVKRSPMKTVDWGFLYNTFHMHGYNPESIETEVKELMGNGDVQKKSGIYPYVLTREEKHLNLRAFSEDMKWTVYENQGRRCAISGKECRFEDMEADHIKPFIEGGKTVLENLQMISKEENRRKGAR